MQIAKDLAGFDRRIEPRHPVSIEGVLIDIKNTTRRFDCYVTDLSESGARLTRLCDGFLPDHLMLFECHGSNIFECEVRWRNGSDVGVRFLDTCSGERRRTLIVGCGLEIVQEMPALRRYLFCLTGSMAITNDIMPMIRAMTKRPAVFGMALNQVALYRTVNSLVVMDDLHAIKLERLEDMHRSVLQLPITERKALLLAYTMGFAMTDVAEILSTTVGQAEQLVSSAAVHLHRLHEIKSKLH